MINAVVEVVRIGVTHVLAGAATSVTNVGGLGQILSVAAPVLVAAIGGLFGYRQAVKIAAQTSSVEGRKLTLAEYEALNRGLNAEIERLREDRREDEERFDRRLQLLEARTERLENERQAAQEALNRLIGWTRMALDVLRRPDVIEALTHLGIDVPAPPQLRPAAGDHLWRNDDG